MTPTRIPLAGLPIVLLLIVLGQATRVSLTPVPPARLPAPHLRARALLRFALALL